MPRLARLVGISSTALVLGSGCTPPPKPEPHQAPKPSTTPSAAGTKSRKPPPVKFDVGGGRGPQATAEPAAASGGDEPKVAPPERSGSTPEAGEPHQPEK